MPAIVDYGTLVQTLGEYVTYDDVGPYLDVAIQMAERRIQQDVRIRVMEQRQEFSGQTSQSVTLPSDFVELIDFYENDEFSGRLDYMTPKQFFSDRRGKTGSGRPVAYTIVGEELLLLPTPDTARDFIMHYYRSAPALTVSESTNFLLTAAPEAYLWASLVECYDVVGDDERKATFENRYMRCVSDLQRADQRSRHRPSGRVRTPSVTRDGAFKIV